MSVAVKPPKDPSKRTKKNIFIIKQATKKDYCIDAQTNQELESWVKAIQEVIERHRQQQQQQQQRQSHLQELP